MTTDLTIESILTESDVLTLWSRQCTIDSLLGGGNFGSVYLGTYGDRECVVKCAPLLANLFEIEAYRLLRHESIVQTFWHHVTKSNYLLLFMERGESSLAHYLNIKGTWLSEKVARIFYRQISSALSYMHLIGIAHLGVYPGNIIVMPESLKCKVTDFGLSTDAYNSSSGEPLVVNSHRQILPYVPPEYFKAKIVPDYFYALLPVGVWSTGVLLFELLNNSLPFDLAHVHVLEHMQNSWLYYQNQHLSPEERQIISMHFNPDPQVRPTIDQIICNAKWLKSQDH